MVNSLSKIKQKRIMGFDRGFRGRGGRGGGQGGDRGGGRGGGRGGRPGNRDFDMGPPEQVDPCGTLMKTCNGQLVIKSTLNERVPYFNAPIYLENKEQIGKVDDIFGPINAYMFTVSLVENVNANSFELNQLFYIDPRRLLPLSRFLPLPPGQKPPSRGNSNRGRGGGRGGGFNKGRGSFGDKRRGGFRGGRGGGGDRGGRGGFKHRGGNNNRGSGGRGFNRGRGGNVTVLS